MTEIFAKELAGAGVRIPEVGIGTWNYHAGPGPLRRGLESGALFIDTAESYGTETAVGEAVCGIRHRAFLATKVSPANFRPADLRAAAENSLGRLGTDFIDLLQLHAPNPEVPIEETMGTMADLVDAGKVRFIGVSNFSVAELQRARKALGKYPVVSNQVRYNVIDWTIEAELLPYCQAHGITVIAYSPLARGPGRIRDCDPHGVIGTIARSTGKSFAQIAINWCLCRDGVVAIPKGNSAAHILENCGASGWRLTVEQRTLLDTGIQYRRRTAIDTLMRRYTPHSVRRFALRTVNALPRTLRRRLL